MGNVAEGQYVIQVSGSAGDRAQAVFNVTAGAFIQLGVNGIIAPLGQAASGTTGTHVTVEGSSFLPGDANGGTCTISSPSSGTVIASGSAACTFFKTSSGFVNATGSFTIGNALEGQYVIQVSGSAGDRAQAILNVTRGAFVQLGVNGILIPLGKTSSGAIGTDVIVEGSYFQPGDTSCTISSPSGVVIAAGCSTFKSTTAPFNGFMNVTGSFTVGNVVPGQYVIQVTGSTGDFAQAVFNVTMGAVVTLTPDSGKPGADISFLGSGFLPTDTSCIVSSPGSVAVLTGSGACVIRAGKGIVNGSFLVGNALPGQYVIQVTGNQGDFAQAVLTVVNGPRLYLNPGSGRQGDDILVNGTMFLPTDSSCTLISGSSNSFNPILSDSGAVAIAVGTGLVNGSFIIGAVPPGQYVIQVTCNQGDSAQAVLRVIGGTPSIQLFPTNAPTGATVTVIAYGLSPSDTGCYLMAYNSETNSPSNTLMTGSSTCSITIPQTAQGSFVVGPYATANIPYNVTVVGTPTNDIVGQYNPCGNAGCTGYATFGVWAPFNVTASINITPPTGSRGSVFTFTGSGFESNATSCKATLIPSLSVTPSCFISGGIGQVAGSLTAPSTAVSGTYGIVITDSTGATATGFFTVGTPSALVVLNPAAVQQGQPVGVAGTGFNPDDTRCTITAGTPAPWTPTGSSINSGGVAPVCSIAGGYASGSFTVSNVASGGYYLITITGYSPTNSTGDFAQNFLAVELQSTVTTYSTTSTTSTTSTSLTTTTTSVATSYSYSSTTVQTTGIYYSTFTHATLTTVSGPTTTSLSVSTTTTQTQTSVLQTITTSFTTVSCGPLPCGFAIKPQGIDQGINLGPFADNVGLLAVLLLIVPMLLRRLFS
ncbi:MAG: hypothetical protein ABSA92_15765 [Candidatus Bathyarchaeia archaeon]